MSNRIQTTLLNKLRVNLKCQNIQPDGHLTYLPRSFADKCPPIRVTGRRSPLRMPLARRKSREESHEAPFLCLRDLPIGLCSVRLHSFPKKPKIKNYPFLPKYADECISLEVNLAVKKTSFFSRPTNPTNHMRVNAYWNAPSGKKMRQIKYLTTF